jgi:hypothetical protein
MANVPVIFTLNRMGHGFWITRERSISKDEWRAFVASRADLSLPNEAFGEIPDGGAAKPNLPEFAWWAGRMPVKVLFSASGIFIEEGGVDAAAFALECAAQLGGTAQEA